MADDAAAEVVSAGRVLKVLTYSGFGPDAGAVSGAGVLHAGTVKPLQRYGGSHAHHVTTARRVAGVDRNASQR